jgi:hypothetical protein
VQPFVSRYFRFPFLILISGVARRSNEEEGKCEAAEARAGGFAENVQRALLPTDEGGERREQQRVGKRSRLPVSIDPPRRSRAHLVFHPTSSPVAFSLCHEGEREREREREERKERKGGGREPSYISQSADIIRGKRDDKKAISCLCIKFVAFVGFQYASGIIGYSLRSMNVQLIRWRLRSRLNSYFLPLPRSAGEREREREEEGGERGRERSGGQGRRF